MVNKTNELNTYLESILPRNESENEFKYETRSKRHLLMFIDNNIESSSYSQMGILINIKLLHNYDNSDFMDITGCISLSPISESISLPNTNLTAREIKLKSYIPYYTRLEINANTEQVFTLLYTDKEVNIYLDALVIDKAINPKRDIVSDFFIIKPSNDKQIIILEYFQEKKDVHFQLESVKAKINDIIQKHTEARQQYHCSIINEIEYNVYVLTAMERNDKQYYLYSYQDYGLCLYYYNSISSSSIDVENPKSMIPNDSTGNELIKHSLMKSPLFIIGKKCKSPGISNLNFIQESLDKITIDDSSKTLHLLLISNSNYTMVIKGITDPNIEIKIFEPKYVADSQGMIISIGNEIELLNENRRLTKLSKVKKDIIFIINQGDKIIEVKLGKEFKEIKETIYNDMNQNIYYKLNSEKEKGYTFTLSLSSFLNSNEFSYEINKGGEGFISVPFKNIVNMNNDFYKILIDNPYTKYGELMNDDFYYFAISFKYPLNNKYTIANAIDNYSNYQEVKPCSINYISNNEVKYLVLNKNYAKTFLVLYVLQCENSNSYPYQITLSYDDGKKLQTFFGEHSKEVFEMESYYVSTTIHIMQKSESADDNTTYNYILSYEYMTKDEKEDILNIMKAKYNFNYDKDNNKLIWKSISKQSSVIYQIYLIEEKENVALNTECEMQSSSEYLLGEIKDKGNGEGNNEYTFNESFHGNYTVNILAKCNLTFYYYIAYEAQKIEIINMNQLQGSNSTSNAWTWVGVSLGVIVGIILIGAIVYYRRKCKFAASENLMLFSSLSSSSTSQ